MLDILWFDWFWLRRRVAWDPETKRRKGGRNLRQGQDSLLPEISSHSGRGTAPISSNRLSLGRNPGRILQTASTTPRESRLSTKVSSFSIHASTRSRGGD